MMDQGSRGLKAIVSDITGGYITINPLFLKSFNETSLRALYKAVIKAQVEIRREAFPYHDVALIRERSIRLQRLSAAAGVIRNFAGEKKYKFF